MASNAPDDLPDGWEMYISSGSDVVLYINTLAKKQRPKPNCPGGWTLAARSPTARILPSHSPDGINAATPSSSTSTVSDSASHAMHRVTTTRVLPNSTLLEEIRCSHILIKHWESRPSSWRSESMKRTKAEAVAMVKNFREQIINKENRFEVIAKVFSDCSSAKRNGDLGRFKRGQMHKSFELVAFKLKVGEISKPIESKSGIHLIMRTL